jgi:hypothetical protein
MLKKTLLAIAVLSITSVCSATVLNTMTVYNYVNNSVMVSGAQAHTGGVPAGSLTSPKVVSLTAQNSGSFTTINNQNGTTLVSFTKEDKMGTAYVKSDFPVVVKLANRDPVILGCGQGGGANSTPVSSPDVNISLYPSCADINK